MGPDGHGGCLDDEQVAALVDGQVDDTARALALAHLDGCARCRRLVALASPDDADEPAAPVDDGARYQLGPRLLALPAGVLHRAEDTRLRRAVAALVARPDEAPAAGRTRLQALARAQAAVLHPHVARALAVTELGGRPALVLALAEPVPLARAIDDMALDERVRIVRDTALAVEAAHRAGHHHADLAPAHLLLEPDDDGAAGPRLFALEATAALDRAGDLAALGALLTHLVPAADDAPAGLAAVVARSRATAPPTGYPTAAALAAALSAHLDGEPAAAGPGGLGRWARRRWRPLFTVALAVTAIAAAALVTRCAAAAERRASIASALLRAQDATALAHRLLADASVLRDRAVAAFTAGRDAAGEAAWARAATVRTQASLELARAERSLEAARLWDPERAEVRAALAQALREQVELADGDRDRGRRDALLARLGLYDRGASAARASAPVPVEVVTEPAGAAIALHRHVAESDGLLRDELVAHLGPTPVATPPLGPGSYLLVLTAAGRATVRYPLRLDAGAPHHLTVALPTAAAVPAELIYVPPGTAFVGNDAAVVRLVSDAWPLHPVELAGFLVGRDPVTVAAWIEWLDTLPGDERERRRPRARLFGAEVALLGGPGAWRYRVGHTSGWQAEAAAGEPLVHPGRTRRASADWRRFPVTGISLDDARAYLAWLERSGRQPGARLCTSAEIDRATRGADDRATPRGAHLPLDDANLIDTYGVAGLGLDEIGSHPGGDSPLGVRDLLGNASTLVEPPPGDRLAVAAGAESFVDRIAAAAGRRSLMPRLTRSPSIGLRVCVSAEGGR